MQKNRTKLFVENFIIYGLITVVDKFIPLIMLPIITRIITDTAEYGAYDMYNTIVEFSAYFVVLGLYDAMFREYFEKDDPAYKSRVTKTTLLMVCASAFSVWTILTVLSKPVSKLFYNDASFSWIVRIAAVGAVVSGLRTVFSAPTRMKNQRLVFAAVGTGSAIVHYGLALVLMKISPTFKWLIWANLIAAGLTTAAFCTLNHRDFSKGNFDKSIARDLLCIGLPLVPTFISYWVFHSMDKIMITQMMGLADVGIYSAGSKVAQTAQIIYAAFAMGWQYFAFSTMKDKDQVKLNSKVFEILAIISFIAFGCATLLDRWFFTLYFSGDYVQGVEVFPFLFLSPLLLMLFQVGANQFIVHKKSYLSTLSVIFGVIVNLILNYTLIPVSGIKGAAAATLVGYLCSVIVMAVVALKYHWMVINPRMLVVCAVSLVTICVLFFGGTADLYANICAVGIIAISTLLYWKDFLGLCKKLFSRKKQ